MAETRATIRTRVQDHVGSAINNTINEAIRAAWLELQRAYNWPEMECTVDPIGIAEGQSAFTLPSDFKEEMNPEMSDIDGTGYRRMRKILKNGIEARNTDDAGRPLMYRIWQGVGILYAKADSAFSIHFEYYRWLDPIESDTPPISDTAKLLDKTYKFLEFRAIAAGYRKLKQWAAADKWDTKADNKLFDLIIDAEAGNQGNQDLQMEMPG